MSNKAEFIEKMNLLADAINEKTGSTTQKDLDELKDAVDGIVLPSGKVEITSTEEVDVSAYATAQVVDDELKGENIVRGKSILGVNGSYDGIIPVGKVSITTANETDVSAYATAQVVDANLVAGNILKNIPILGVMGTAKTADDVYGEILVGSWGS